MPSQRIYYKSGYKYQLAQPYSLCVRPIRPRKGIVTAFICLDLYGTLTIRDGYAWDGPSGPAWDTRNFMRGSLVHDALYQLIREGHLPKETRAEADQMLYTCVREDGMSWPRAHWVYWGVRWGGGPAIDQERPVLAAP